jgi:hypothetical protein
MCGVRRDLRLQEGDATNVEGLADRSFDLVVSIFGTMFAPRLLAATDSRHFFEVTVTA